MEKYHENKEIIILEFDLKILISTVSCCLLFHQEVASLVCQSRVEDWNIFTCVNCAKATHALHAVKGHDRVLISQTLEVSVDVFFLPRGCYRMQCEVQLLCHLLLYLSGVQLLFVEHHVLMTVCMYTIHIQSTLSKVDTLGKATVRFREESALERVQVT